ncbi:unnamed protein product [Mytilus edulis]|uniref:Uncharacterized protein n=1 Tax=Mytilus edulis TaxID=6550 RepID=A0A8S3USU4_MYTED|nr:unnamed protein product [Mytilus edulis]
MEKLCPVAFGVIIALLFLVAGAFSPGWMVMDSSSFTDISDHDTSDAVTLHMGFLPSYRWKGLLNDYRIRLEFIRIPNRDHHWSCTMYTIADTNVSVQQRQSAIHVTGANYNKRDCRRSNRGGSLAVAYWSNCCGNKNKYKHGSSLFHYIKWTRWNILFHFNDFINRHVQAAHTITSEQEPMT